MRCRLIERFSEGFFPSCLHDYPLRRSERGARIQGPTSTTVLLPSVAGAEGDSNERQEASPRRDLRAHLDRSPDGRSTLHRGSLTVEAASSLT
jgi:hypothetical protein